MKTKKMLAGVGVKVKVKGEEQDDNWDIMCVPPASEVENQRRWRLERDEWGEQAGEWRTRD